MKKHKRPPQGTHAMEGARLQNIRRSRAEALLDAIQFSIEDPLVAALADAKHSRDQSAIGRLLPVFLERYGRGRETLRLYRAL